jgi:uncharacterized membrane protein
MEVLLGLAFGLITVGLLVLLIVYVVKTNAIVRRLTEVEDHVRRLRFLEDDVAELRRKVPGQVSVAEPRPAVESPKTVEPSFAASPPPQPVEPPVSAIPFTVPSAPVKSSRSREEWEALIGGKLLNRIGALALIIGVGFFLKYAFDNNWITETMRVTIGFVIGIGLLIIAARAHKKAFEVFAQGLVGAGIAVLYLSVFASFSFYHLVPQIPAFALMSSVTVLAFLQAFRYDSLTVSLLGLLGGFLTPFLLSTGEANELGLFTYIALLDAGILAILLMKDEWAVLEPLALVSTYLVYLLWYKEYYTGQDLLTTSYFLTVFWLMFLSLEAYRSLRSVNSFLVLRSVVASASLVFFYSGLYSILEPVHHELVGLVTLLIGVAYFGTALFLQRRTVDAMSFSRRIATAMVLLVVATAIQFTGFTTVMWWSIEAVALVFCGLRWRMSLAWIFGVAVYAFAILKLLFLPDAFGSQPVIDASLLLNKRALTFLLLAVSMGASAWWLRKQTQGVGTTLVAILNYFWPTVLFALITAETAGYFEALKIISVQESLDGLNFKELMTLSVVWMLYAVPLLWFGINRQLVPLQHVALAVGLLSIGLAGVRGLNFEPIQDFRLLANYRVFSMLCVIAGTFLQMRILRARDTVGKQSIDIVGSIGVVLVILLLDLLTAETKDFFQNALVGVSPSGAEYSRLRDLQQLSLSGVWLLYSILLMVAGIWRRHRGIRIVSIVLFGFTILKIFIYDLSFLETLYRIFSFIGLGVILLVVSYLYQRYKEVILGAGKFPTAGDG